MKHFKEDLDKNIESKNTINFCNIHNTFIAVLHKHVLVKKIILRFNKITFMSKALRNVKDLSDKKNMENN